LSNTRLQTLLVVHCNHPNELDGDVCHALKMLKEGGITLLNQSVILAGVNACPNLLAELSERLFAAGCLPYYLHLLDQVKGSHHFLVTEEEARKIHHKLQGILPGFLVPRLVKEESSHHSKSWLA
jgi:L-lysine 2,3-aminomutase